MLKEPSANYAEGSYYYIEKKTNRRVQMGPATLYTIFAKFEKEKYIKEIEAEGRKRTYCITDRGIKGYMDEAERLRNCIKDAVVVLNAHS